MDHDANGHLPQTGRKGKAGTPIVRIALCLPFYDGPDVHCFEVFFAHQAYYGRLMERSMIREEVWAKYGKEAWNDFDLPPLDPLSNTGLAELLDTDPIFEFIYCKQIKVSLPGAAREGCVELALKYDADYCFFFDNDMLFTKETFLRLYRHHKPVVYALAFTAREPILPVVYRWNKRFDKEEMVTKVDSEWLESYPKNTLFRVDAHGAGINLTNIEVFKTIPENWFNAQGAGEDIHFCRLCYDYHIDIYCDSSLWTAHKPNSPTFWHDEAFYEQSKAIMDKINQHEKTTELMAEEIKVA